jgi:hypothetical protein
VTHLGEASRRRRADLQREAFERAKLGEALLDGIVALPQRVVFGVADGRRVVLVVALVVRLDLRFEPRVLGLGLFGRESVDGRFRVLARRHDEQRKYEINRPPP